MAPASDHHRELFDRLKEGKELTPGEIEQLISWLGEAKLDPEAADLILSQLKKPMTGESIDPAITAALEARLPLILRRKEERPLLRSLRTHWVRYAAAVMILVASLTFFLRNNHPQSLVRVGPPPATIGNDVLPGKNGAILTLADGRTVVLDSQGNGVIAMQNGSKVSLNNGRLAYNAEGAAAGAPVASATSDAAALQYNTMTTPRGRQFQVVLPDGTKVWLNAASSLRYPTQFTGSDRKVEVKGEAYFEVARNEKMPFVVKVNEATEIQVLGTHFNINSYDDESTVKTTLLEGSVRIAYNGEKRVLKPSEQAQVARPGADARVGSNGMVAAGLAPGGIKILQDVRVEKVVAWKNGVFDFQDASLEEVMRQLERWYDIEVVYEKNIPQLEFIGKMGRDLTLSNVLRGLELSKVHFRMEGTRKLVILP